MIIFVMIFFSCRLPSSFFPFYHFLFLFPIFSFFLFFFTLLLLLLLPVTCAEPSAPPQEVQCSSPSSTSLLVSWRPPPAGSQNGPIVGYTVSYVAVVGGGAGLGPGPEIAESVQTSADVDEVVLQRLEKWTQYRVTVSAATGVGAGPESPVISCRTDEDGTTTSSSPCVCVCVYTLDFYMLSKLFTL